jgi:hypothetical protein
MARIICDRRFILVPVIPAMGKFILDYYNWHGIFSVYHQYAGFVFVLETATRDIIR